MGMVSLKMKNYALIDRDGHTILKGSSLRSRREEPILRTFLQEAITLFVAGSNGRRTRTLSRHFADRIQRKAYEPREICRWETVTEKTFSSESNRRLAEAARGIAVGERLEVYQRIDGTLGRLENYAGDEDTSHMLRRLHDMAERFSELFEDSRDRDYHFPLLTADERSSRACAPPDQSNNSDSSKATQKRHHEW